MLVTSVTVKSFLMHAAHLCSRACWQSLGRPCHRLTGCSPQLSAVRTQLVCHATGIQPLSVSRLEQDLAEVLSEPEGEKASVNTADRLTPWQRRRVQEAAALGRRKVKVNDLSHELQIPRGELLKLLKSEPGSTVRTNADKLPAVDATISSASAPSPAAMQLSAGSSASALQAAQPQSAVEQNMIGQAEAPGQIPVQAASDRQGTAAEPRFEHMEHQTALRQANRQQMMPKSKKKQASTMPFAQRQSQRSDYDNKRLSKAVEATLETVYAQSTHPSDDVLQGVFELHRGVSRKKVIDWLGQRRRSDKSIRRDTVNKTNWTVRSH